MLEDRFDRVKLAVIRADNVEYSTGVKRHALRPHPPSRGPVWRGGRFGEAEFLASCYRNSLAIAAERSLRTIAFPSISTGAYGYPIEEAAKTAVETVREVLSGSKLPMEVTFCCFSESDLAVYQRLLNG